MCEPCATRRSTKQLAINGLLCTFISDSCLGVAGNWKMPDERAACGGTMIVDQVYRQTLSGHPYWAVSLGHACGLLFKSLRWLWLVLAAMQAPHMVLKAAKAVRSLSA